MKTNLDLDLKMEDRASPATQLLPPTSEHKQDKQDCKRCSCSFFMHNMPSRKTYSNHKQPFKPQNPTSATKPLKTAEPSLSKKAPIELQQIVLDAFRNCFAPRFNSGFPTIVQQIKQHLFNRDFKNAFAHKSFLEAYAMRWSPSRALAYTQIFWEILSEYYPEHRDLKQGSGGLPLAASQVQSASTERVVCIGGGAGAELVALTAYLQGTGHHRLKIDDPQDKSERWPPSFAITAIDIADWSTVLEELHSCMTVTPPISESFSAAAKAKMPTLISPAACTLSFMQEDVLKMKTEDSAMAFADAALVTLMFTLNELYSTSISSTTNLLLSLTMLLRPGSLLLVVDSPGSYSTVSVGKASSADDGSTRRRYPMQWLLDHTLLESSAIATSRNTSEGRQWEKVQSKESEWFRLSSQLRYPVSLEDMRYQLHLYRRLW